MDWQQRIDSYHQSNSFPKSLFVAGDGRVVGTWLMGNDYRVRSGYYGGYPHGYLKRIMALFPDKMNVLHLFSGMVEWNETSHTVDIRADLKPTYLMDAHDMSKIPLQRYDLVLADPPYSSEDAEHYGTPMVNRTKIMYELESVQPHTHVVWLDQAWPMYNKAFWDLEGVIGMVRSTNHRVRMIFIFRRRESTRKYIRL